MSAEQQALLYCPAAGFSPIDVDDANELLVRWGHNLGAVNRPFRSEAWAFELDGQPISVAISASLVSATVSCSHGSWRRGQAVELARLCTRPGDRWATRVALRLWREVAAPRWACWPVDVAVAYSQNDRHEGRIYRHDGWEKASDRCGSMGGGGRGRESGTPPSP